jgi:Cu2+-exporting ATPase/Cu+-exporting ATPase
MMVGDGANDAIALTSADVGVAVLGAMDISLRAADVYLTTPGLAPVEKLITLSEETMKVIHRNLVLSLAYNSLSVTAAFMGLINPLVAAIIMPLSSLTVLISTVVGTKKLRSLWKS